MPKSPIPAAGGAMPARKPSTPEKRASRLAPASEAPASRLSGGDVSEARAEATTPAPKANGKAASGQGPASGAVLLSALATMPPDALAKLTIADLAHLHEAFAAAHAAFVSIESMPHSYDALSASGSQVIDEEISRCGSAQNQITRELETRRPKDEREQEVMRATLLTQRAGEDITEVLHVLALTTGPLIEGECQSDA